MSGGISQTGFDNAATMTNTSLAPAISDLGDSESANIPMRTFNMYYTTFRLSATIHMGDSSSLPLYFLESSVFTTSPSLYLRRGGKKSSPMVSFVKARWTSRQLILGLGDCTTGGNEGAQAWDTLSREKSNFRRSDYHVTVLSRDGSKGMRSLTWQKDKSKRFRTVYACLDENGQVVGRLRSGGMFNWKKAGEIDLAETLGESDTELLLAAAGGIWGVEAMNYQTWLSGGLGEK
ncbi:hypothetical protein NLG97_g3406 [Lecanicillium saksenae]|uniref:Uncharacterized protein n=1 Tax=Lecanicillium saksenae TaxID=468837 RepID=A0ACC1QZE4_9HYPO|nr:hypothetical protein NLG97_g3406 [Lecanicillium saksenae]